MGRLCSLEAPMGALAMPSGTHMWQRLVCLCVCVCVSQGGRGGWRRHLLGNTSNRHCVGGGASTPLHGAAGRVHGWSP